MRKFSLSRRMTGCLLGMQFFCFVAARSQSTYAYSNISRQAVQQKSLGDSKPGDNKPVDNGRKQSFFSVITGKVVAADGTPVAGVNVIVKGSKRGTSTNATGAFSIEANNGDVLVFSYVGYTTQEVVVSSSTLSVTLLANDKQLNEVVVTALGIQRPAKSLTYSVQKVGNDQLTTVQDASFVNSLTGKVAGIVIAKSSSGIGGSTRVTLRGNHSTRNNQPLYVVDGVPLVNFSPAQPGDEFGQSGVGYVGLDGGDGISNMNPDDIESVTILKGASAAALYGSAAANGVILITTKKGKAGKTRVDVSSSVTMDSRMYKAPLQFKYGQTTTPSLGNPGSLDSWGGVVNAPDHVDPFFQTGSSNFNSIAISGGTDRSQTYLSYSFTDNTGDIPTVSLDRHNLNFRQTTKYFDDRLTSDINVMFINQDAHNRPPSGVYDNPLTGLYLFPRGLNFSQYKQYSVYSPLRNTGIQNWWDANYDSTQVYGSAWNSSNSANEQNPYWILHRTTTDNDLNRIYSNISLNYKFNSWLNLQARGNVDKSWNTISQKAFATTSTVLTANNGGYGLLNAINTQYYGDLLLSANHKLTPDLGLSATLGTAINDQVADQTVYGTKNSGNGLAFANVFTLNNILPAAYQVSPTYTHKQIQSAFFTGQLNLKEFLYLDVSGRNDWSSSMAYTPVASRGFFYWSAGLTGILSDMVHLPDPISFAKVRVSYAQVGNDVDAYASNPPEFTIDNQNGLVTESTGPAPGTYLRPESNRSFEVGTAWRFLNDRAGFDFTYYLNNNLNQYITTAAPPGAALNQYGYSYSIYATNAGNIRNQGVELSIDVTPVKERHLIWTSTVNYAYNKNLIVSISNPALTTSTDYQQLTGIGNLLYASFNKKGGQWGDIYGYFFQRDASGAIVVNASGAPQEGSDSTEPVGNPALKRLGNPMPSFTLGWSNSFTVDRFVFNILFDGKFGGKVMSVTQAYLDFNGDSKASQMARDRGGVFVNADNSSGGKFGAINPQVWYTTVGGLSGISENYMYDATNIRLREASLAYQIPTRAKWVKALSVSVIGRNLFFIVRKAPFDPEISSATNNGLQGVDTFGPPSTRSVGASVKFGF
jgi:TonB-linked SusC/RagA family outer membrane protein